MSMFGYFVAKYPGTTSSAIFAGMMSSELMTTASSSFSSAFATTTGSGSSGSGAVNPITFFLPKASVVSSVFVSSGFVSYSWSFDLGTFNPNASEIMMRSS